MNLDDVVNGSTVLIDTNVLLYARANRSRQCRHLLQRCEQGSVVGLITLPTLAEFCHRAMVQEAQTHRLVGSNPARTLSERPELVRQLSAYAEAVRDLLDNGPASVECQSQDLLVALELQKQYGLLTNDSLNLAIARRHGVQEIATADTSFDNVQGIVVYKPEDITI